MGDERVGVVSGEWREVRSERLEVRSEK